MHEIIRKTARFLDDFRKNRSSLICLNLLEEKLGDDTLLIGDNEMKSSVAAKFTDQKMQLKEEATQIEFKQSNRVWAGCSKCSENGVLIQ